MLLTTKGCGNLKKEKITVDQNSLGTPHGVDKNEMNIEAHLNMGIWRGRERHREGGELHWIVFECYCLVFFLLIILFSSFSGTDAVLFVTECLSPNSSGSGGVVI